MVGIIAGESFRIDSRHVIIVILVSVLVSSCQQLVQEEVIVLEGNLEEGLPPEISAPSHIFEGSTMIGPFNNDGFEIPLTRLPDHNYLLISFELIIHDAWEGNKQTIDGPDFWTMTLETDPENPSAHDYRFQTTFSTSPCVASHCVEQSYPNAYPFSHPPNAESSRFSPGRCFGLGNPIATTRYNIEKVISHRDDDATFSFFDNLVQENVEDNFCDETWSMDNITIKALLVN